MLNPKVKDFMIKDVVVASVDDNIKDVIDKMSKNNISSVVIIDDDRIIDIITERDLVKWISKSKDILDEKVGKYIDKTIISIDEDTKLTKVSKLMKQYNVRHFPVVDKKNRITGIVTETDVLKEISRIVKINQVIQGVLLIVALTIITLVLIFAYFK